MRQQGIDAVEKEGLYYMDDFGEPVTTLVNKKNVLLWCLIKIILQNVQLKFQVEKTRLISLNQSVVTYAQFRVKEYERFQGINLHKWHICEPVWCGKDLKVPVFKF